MAKKLIAAFCLILFISLCADAQVLGISGVDSTKIKNVPANEPKPELKAFDNNPNNGASQQPSDKKKETEPVLAPTSKPKTEE